MGTLVLAAQLVLAVVFATAAVGKLLDLPGSRRAMEAFGVPKRVAPLLGTLLPLAELAVAVALVPAPTARWGALAGLALLLAFIGGIGAAMARGQAPDCHCFGQIHSAPAGPMTLVRNGVLAALALLVVVHGAGPPVDDWVSARSAAELVAVAFGIAAAGLGALSLQLWADRRKARADLAISQAELESLPPGLPVGLGAPGFALPDMEGKVRTLQSLCDSGIPTMLIFTGPRCSACKVMYPQVGRWQQALAGRLNIVVMTGGTREENLALVQEHDLDNVILQEDYEVMWEYRVRATPSAVVVAPDLTVATLPATGEISIEPLIRLALVRDIAPGRAVTAGQFED
jgi:uncharacterized membrane protein YphA (DoxX/SURF4 family)